MATVGECLQTWKLKLSTTKTVSAAFHLNNKEAKPELEVKYNNNILPFCHKPKYFAVTLNRSLTYCRVTSQEADNTCRAPVATCWLWLGCWGNNFVNNHHSCGTFKHRVLHSGTAVLTLASLTPPLMTPCELLLERLRPIPADNLPCRDPTYLAS